MSSTGEAQPVIGVPTAVLDLHSIPKLARSARLRRDPAGDGWVLVYPERGLFLNETAARNLGLCDGRRSIAVIVGELRAEHADAAPLVHRDVVDFFCELRSRGVVRFERAAAREA
mgnify:CR=1 FL=1